VSSASASQTSGLTLELELLRACESLEPEYLVSLLKAVKHLSMNSNLLDVLQNANAIEILIRIMVRKSSGPYGTVRASWLYVPCSRSSCSLQEIANHLYHTLYNLCRLNKSRQEEAAQAGIIPCLKRVSEINSPLRQFALPILCDLAGAGKACRAALWMHDGLQLYIQLLTDPYFQVSALDAIFSWCGSSRPFVVLTNESVFAGCRTRLPVSRMF